MPRSLAASSHPRSCCRCAFGVCTAPDLAAFMLRLPVHVKKKSSPIYAYLRAVYNAELSLPFDMRKIEAFYPGLLPTEPCVDNGPSSDCHKDHSESCNAQCSSWQPRPAPDAASVEAFLVNRSFIRTSSSTAAEGEQPFGHVVALQSAPPKRKAVPQRSWAEVTRLADTYSSRAEGMNDYGCWLYPARGTGVWVYAGSSLVWPTWKSAHTTVRQVTNYQQPVKSDELFARTAASRGFDSFQIVRSHGRTWGWMAVGETHPAHELVLVGHPSCMRSTARLRSGCLPQDVELRTGPNASVPCVCDGRTDAPLRCVPTVSKSSLL